MGGNEGADGDRREQRIRSTEGGGPRVAAPRGSDSSWISTPDRASGRGSGSSPQTGGTGTYRPLGAPGDSTGTRASGICTGDPRFSDLDPRGPGTCGSGSDGCGAEACNSGPDPRSTEACSPGFVPRSAQISGGCIGSPPYRDPDCGPCRPGSAPEGPAELPAAGSSAPGAGGIRASRERTASGNPTGQADPAGEYASSERRKKEKIQSAVDRCRLYRGDPHCRRCAVGDRCDPQSDGSVFPE